MLKKLTSTKTSKKRVALMERTAMGSCDTNCMWRCIELMNLDFDNYAFLWAVS